MDKDSPSPSVKVSTIPKLVRTMFPVFLTLIVYWIISPVPVSSSPLSMIVAVLVTSIDVFELIVVIVGSLVVLPSVSSPSSLISVMSFVFPGLLAVAVTELETKPVPAVCSTIV